MRAYGSEEWDIGRLTGKWKHYHNAHLNFFLFAWLRGAARRTATYAGAIVLFVTGIGMVRTQSITVGEFVAFSFYYFTLINSVATMVTLTTEQRMVLVQAEKLHSFMHAVPDVKEPARPVMLERLDGRLTFRDVHFSYDGRPQAVLNGVNLDIRAGEKLAIVGTSGSGKSTLIKLVGRFYDPAGGEILLDGVPLRQLPFSQLRGSIGYVFQETYLFGKTVRENIRFGNPDATDEQVAAAARAAHAHDFIEQLPEGYDTQVGERGIKLSGGQKQRIAVARMFIKNPSIILLDEATSALDNVSEYEVKRALDELLDGRTTIAVAHRLSTIRNYDRIAVMERGVVAEIGAYEELMRRKGPFFRLSQGQTEPDGQVG